MLTITTTHEPATDLGYLLHKHPDRLQAFELAFCAAHVFYPEASDQRCTAALMLEIDPIRLTRRGGSAQGGKFLQDYINDRPYAASSHLRVAIAKVYRTAMSGRCDALPELAGSPIPLTAQVDSVSSQHGPELARRMLEPLGYEVQTETLPLDPAFPDWGDSVLHNLTIASGERTLADLLRHLYVLLPVLDNQKHYWVGNDELEKLMRFGEGWLESHPAREMISRRYLGFRRGLTLRAQEQLEAAAEAVAEADDGDDEQAQEEKPEGPGEKTRVNESDLEGPMSLHAQRIQAVLEEVRESGAGSVLDLGCGEGRLLEELLKHPGLRLARVEVSGRRLGVARQRLGARGATSQEAQRAMLLHGSLLYGTPGWRDTTTTWPWRSWNTSTPASWTSWRTRCWGGPSPAR